MRQFGGIDQMKEVHRDDRSARWIENLVKDARYGLAVACGASRCFALVADRRARARHRRQHRDVQPRRRRAVQAAALPESRAHRPHLGDADADHRATPRRRATFEELKRQSRSFEALSAESLSTATVPVNGEPIRLNGRYVSADHFAVFGVQPFIGRTFRPEEDQAGADRVVILSHAAWQTAISAAIPASSDRDLLLDNEPHRVIGVLPAGRVRSPSRPAAAMTRRASGG